LLSKHTGSFGRHAALVCRRLLGSMEQSSISLDGARFHAMHICGRTHRWFLGNRFPYRLASVMLTRFFERSLCGRIPARATAAGFIIVHIQRIDTSVANKSKRFRGAYGNPPCRVVPLASSSTMVALFGVHITPRKHGYAVFKKGGCTDQC
jgi:hypothetical protein